MDVAAGIRPAGRWLERSSPATYQRALIWIVALSLAYYATAVAVYARLMMPTLPSVAVLWPPNVLLFVAFLLTPVRLWPLIVLFALPTQLAVAATMDIPLGRSLGMFTGNLSQPIIAAAILRRLGQGERMLETLRGATAFILVAALGAPAIASVVSAATLSATGWITDPLAALADAVCHQCPLDDRARAAAADFSSLALVASPARSPRRGVPDPADLSDRQRAARQLTRDIRHLLSAALRAAPVPVVGRRPLRTSGARHRPLFHRALSILCKRSSWTGARHAVPMRSSRRSSRSSPSHCR